MNFRPYLALFLIFNCPFIVKSNPSAITPSTIGALVGGIALGIALTKAERSLDDDRSTATPTTEKLVATIGTIAGILTLLAGLQNLDKSKKLYQALLKVSNALLKKRFFGKAALRRQHTTLSIEASKNFYQGLLMTLFGGLCSTYGIGKLTLKN